MDFATLKKALKDKAEIPKFLVFTGKEKEVQSRYIKQIDEKYKVVDKIEQLPNLMKYRGLIASSSTFVTADPKAINLTKENIKALTAKSRLIIVLDKIDKRSVFYKAFKKSIVEFNKFTEEQLIPYIQKQVAMEQQSALALAIYCNNEVARVDMELDKLVRLEEAITLDVIQSNIAPPLEDAIFEMIEGVVKKDAPTVFELLDDMLELRESPIKVISILYNKVRDVFMVQSLQQYSNADIAEKAKMTLWQVNMTRELCNIETLENLIQNLQKIQEFEVYMKTGQVEPELGIEYLLARLVEGA